jgi:predicted secreted protein
MTKYRALGTTLTVNGVLINQWRDGSSTGGEAERIDVTTMDSDGGYREFLTGFKGESSYTFTIEYDPADTSHLELAELYATGEVVDVSIGLPTTPATTIEFDASVSGFSIPAADVGGSLTVEVSLTVAGAIAFPVAGS